MKPIFCPHCGTRLSPNDWTHLGDTEDYKCWKCGGLVIIKTPKEGNGFACATFLKGVMILLGLADVAARATKRRVLAYWRNKRNV